MSDPERTTASCSKMNFSCLTNVSKEHVTPIVWTTTHTLDDGSVDERAYRNGYAVSTVALIIFMLGTPLNYWVVSVILYKKLCKVAAVIPMLSLALSNLLLCHLILPFIIVSGYSREFIFGSSDYSRCKVCSLGVANVILPYVSAFNLALMSVGKLLYLKFPLKYDRLFTPKRTALVSLLFWVMGILIALPPLFGFGTVLYFDAAATCVPLIIGGGEIFPSHYYTLPMSGVAIITLSTTTLMYLWVALIIRRYILQNPVQFAKINANAIKKSLKNTEENGKQHGIKHHGIKQIKLIQLLGIIILSNIVTWTPLLILGIIGAITEELPTPLISAFYLLYLSEVVIHPLVQIMLIHELKETVIVLLSTLKKTKLFNN